MRLAIFLLMVFATSAWADVVVANRTIRPGEIISANDLVLKAADVAGAARTVDEISGLEARVALYPGRPIAMADVGPPAIVDRNQLVTLVYEANGLRISAEGRALGRGAPGDFIRVMNLTSRSTITGRVGRDGTIQME